MSSKGLNHAFNNDHATAVLKPVHSPCVYWESAHSQTNEKTHVLL